MRVLLTGFTIRQCGELDEQRYVSFFKEMLPGALRLAGHQVENRRILPGEDIRGQYDVALIGVHPMASMSSCRRYGALWVATQLPYVVVLEDWKVKLTIDHMKTQNYLWKTSHLDGEWIKDFNRASPHCALIDKVRARWSRTLESMLLPMVEWADPGLFTKLAPHVTNPVKWDCSPWTPVLGSSAPMSSKERKWVLTSLGNQDAWLSSLNPAPSWPVMKLYKRAGEERSKEPIVEQPGRMDEIYGRSTGIMMPHYGRECLNGWWRPRPQFAAQVRSVLFAERAEVVGFGDGYWQPHHTVERMSDHELTQVAEHQARCVQRWIVTKEESARRLVVAIDAAVQPPVRPEGV